MRYTYTAAWAVVGGITLRDDSLPIELVSSESAQFTLTRDPDDVLARVDEASAVGRLMLKGIVGQQAAQGLRTRTAFSLIA